MSARHPTPWRTEGRDNGKRGRQRREFWAVIDRNEFFVAEGLDERTAREVVDAVNGRERLRADLRSLADEFDGYAEADGIRAPAYASLFRSLAERLRGMVEARPAAAPLGRPATEEEVDGGKAQWCQACVAKCPLAGRDALAVCERFEEGGAR